MADLFKRPGGELDKAKRRPSGERHSMVSNIIIAVLSTITAATAGQTVGPSERPSFPPIQDAVSVPPGGDALLRAARERGFVGVILGVNAPRGNDELIRAQTARAVEAVAPLARSPFRRVGWQPAIAGVATEQELLNIFRTGLFVAAVEDRESRPNLPSGRPLVFPFTPWLGGALGNGQVVAVIDTGVDTAHPMFSGRVRAEYCFSSGDWFGGESTCGERTTGNGAAAPCSVGGCNHGTHVSGIAVGNGTFSSNGRNFGLQGVAQNAQLVAINAAYVRDGVPYFRDSDVITAVDTVRKAHQNNDYAVAAINMSLGLDENSSDTCVTPILDLMNWSIEDARKAGIAVVVASGNDSRTNGIGYPACKEYATRVGNFTDAGQAWHTSNTSPILDFVAPGTDIQSARTGNRSVVSGGTSMAAPMVAGAFAVMKSRFSSASVSSIEDVLKSTADILTDQRTNRRFPQPRLDRALVALGDVPMVGDVTGDGRDELIIWRPSDATWHVFDHQRRVRVGRKFRMGAQHNHIPLVGDVDGDKKAELIIWRNSDGRWFVADEFGNREDPVQWGRPGDIPMLGDMDGDGADDFVIRRPKVGEWFAKTSKNKILFRRVAFGGARPHAMLADMDNDKKDDLVLWNGWEHRWEVAAAKDITSGTWEKRSAVGYFWQKSWGRRGDVPLTTRASTSNSGDAYVIWRPSDGTWYSIAYDPSRPDQTRVGRAGVQWGRPGDVPMTADIDADGWTEFVVYRPGTGEWFAKEPTGKVLFRNVEWGIPN